MTRIWLPAEKVALDLCHWMDPLVALAGNVMRMCPNAVKKKKKKKKNSPLRESDPDFHSHLLTLGGRELGGDN